MDANPKWYVGLHALLALFSLSGVLSKLAASERFLGPRFCLLYGGALLALAAYALLWQQVIRRLPLSVAYANRAVTIVWGLVWGALVFGETVTPGRLAGAAIVMAGVVLYTRSGGRDGDGE